MSEIHTIGGNKPAISAEEKVRIQEQAKQLEKERAMQVRLSAVQLAVEHLRTSQVTNAHPEQEDLLSLAERLTHYISNGQVSNRK